VATIDYGSGSTRPSNTISVSATQRKQPSQAFTLWRNPPIRGPKDINILLYFVFVLASLPCIFFSQVSKNLIEIEFVESVCFLTLRHSECKVADIL
jgi:hypothetical protein